jgi:hypothetical protein
MTCWEYPVNRFTNPNPIYESLIHVIIYIASLIEIGPGIQKLILGDADTQTA